MAEFIIIQMTNFFVGMIAYVLSGKRIVAIITTVISIIIWSLLIILIKQ